MRAASPMLALLAVLSMTGCIVDDSAPGQSSPEATEDLPIAMAEDQACRALNLEMYAVRAENPPAVGVMPRDIRPELQDDFEFYASVVPEGDLRTHLQEMAETANEQVDTLADMGMSRLWELCRTEELLEVLPVIEPLGSLPSVEPSNTESVQP